MALPKMIGVGWAPRRSLFSEAATPGCTSRNINSSRGPPGRDRVIGGVGGLAIHRLNWLQLQTTGSIGRNS
eukprot:4662166-Alexandrium_andersonii.AAC.1